jgi:chemotaxis signal transduction protein
MPVDVPADVPAAIDEPVASVDEPAAAIEPIAAVEQPAADEPATDADAYLAAMEAQVAAFEARAGVVDAPAPAVEEPVSAAVDEPVGLAGDAVPPAGEIDEHSEAAFVLTPFEAGEAEAAPDAHTDADALWAAAVPDLGLEVAPLLDLEAVDIAPADGPVALTGVVLPWPTQDAKPGAAEPSAHDLIEAALAGLHADLTSEPVEPLRTPDVAVSTAHVVFRLGTRRMAIALSAVSEIARPPKVTRLPHVPAWVLGIANLRGDIVSMLDLEGFFSGKPGRSSHEQRMLALRPAGDEVRTAVLVDGVDGIQAFEDARIARVTRGYDAEVAPYARGLYQMEDDLVVVLDADRLLQSKPMRQFEDGAGAR